MLKSKLKSRTSINYDSANPMDSVSNMSDAMLVLAVGIMLALVINWKVDLQIAYNDTNKVDISDKEKELIDLNEGKTVNNMSLEDIESMYKKTGEVYTDMRTGKSYVIVEE